MIDCNKSMEKKYVRKKLCTGRKVCCKRRQKQGVKIFSYFERHLPSAYVYRCGPVRAHPVPSAAIELLFPTV